MVIRGATRGNGQQLAKYLLTMSENEDIRILDVNGRNAPKDQHLQHALLSMSLTSELTKSDKGLYHAQINPGYGDDETMTGERWMQAADMLGEELGLGEQRRVMVLHRKKGRTHAHVVWERYDLKKGRMISDSFSRLAQDRVRKDMEKLFEHKPTPSRNEKRPEMKTLLSALWGKIKTGAGFVQEAKKLGYIIAAGVQRRPFMVVDDTGRSFDLVRQLDGIKTKEVRERLKDEKLVAEKDAITLVRTRQKLVEKIKQEETPLETTKVESNAKAEIKPPQSNKEAIAKLFADAREEFTTLSTPMPNAGMPPEPVNKIEATAALFKAVKDDIVPKQISQEEKNKSAADSFAANREEALSPEADRERKRQAILKQLEQAKQAQKSKDRGREPD